MIIDKRMMFVVRMAKNLEARSAEHRRECLAQLHPKARALVNRAFVVMNQQKMEKDNDLRK